MIDLRFNCFFAIQSVSSINMTPPIRKPLVLTNQSPSGSLIYFPYNVLTKYFAMLCKSITKYAGL